MRDQIAQRRQGSGTLPNNLYTPPQAAMGHIEAERPQGDVVLRVISLANLPARALAYPGSDCIV